MNASDLTTKILTCQRRLPAALSAILLALITSSASADLDVDNTTRITPVSVQPIAIQPSVVKSSPIQSTITDLTIIAPAMNISTNAITRCEDNRQNKTSKYQTKQQRDIACMIEQLQPYQQANVTARQQYLAFKAQAWLNYANNKYSMNSRASIADYAFESGKEIFLALKNNDEQNINLVRDIPTTSDMMRPDLWAMLSALKTAGGINSAPRELAFSEVSLIWAAADHCARGWRESSPRFRMGERWLEQTREAYVNANSSTDSAALIEQINSYYKQYEQLDPRNNICNGQVMPVVNQTQASATSVFIPMPMPTATYTLSN
ncbi:hypothetical protein [Psychrobacter sp. DM4]|uniref:hypothetical protein n=1 Tax=Psychrobacter sp. DM4 TaxID=3440637 RepID=UPI003F50CE95